MRDNLHAPRNGQPSSGNHTASRTVLPSGSGSGSGGWGLTGAFGGHNPPKRQKTSHYGESSQSQYFTNGAAGTGRGKGKGKGKGKEPANSLAPSSKRTTVEAGTMETIVVSDDEVPTRVILEGRPGRRSTSAAKDDGEGNSSSDPLDCIGPDLSPIRPTPSEPPDPFERAPSPRSRPNMNALRLPADGAHTRQLQKKYQLQRPETMPEVVDVDTLSDDIESASGFDLEDEAKAAAAEAEAETEVTAKAESARPSTPNGRANIRPGSVKERVRALEGKRVAKPPPKPSSSGGNTPFYDLKSLPQPISRKAGMKGKNQKPLSSTVPSSRASVEAAGPLDPAATSPSGFKPSKGKGKSNANASVNGNISTPIPLEAWSLGCRLSRSEDKHEPVAWIIVEHIPKQRTYLLRVSRTPDKRGAELSINLDRDVDQLEYTDPESTWDEDSVAVVKLHSTKLLKCLDKGPFFDPGHRRAPGFITFKFMTQHPNFIDGEAYKALVSILNDQIKDHSVQRGSQSAAKAWQMTEAAAEGFAREPREPKQRQTRSNTSLKRQSPVSAGPANDDSTTVLPSEHSSTSAPPTRTYGTERRTTRQSARIARKSPSPISDPDELLLVYPPTGTGAVNITRGDLKRLDEGQYLNDTLIEFGLKLWLDELRRSDPEKAEQVHVFNSFFYKKLSSKKEVADTYPSVRKWSSKIDIFSKKYVIVPINENFHWYLAIIENPADMLHPPPPEARNAPQTRKRKRESAAAEAELVSEDKDPPAEDGTETATETSKQPSEQPEPSTPPNHVPDAMAVDGDSEGDLQEVDSLLEMTQTQLSVSGPARSPSRDAMDGELQYPGSEDPMDVDSVPVPGREDGRKSSAQTPIVVDDDSSMDVQAKAAESEEGDSKPDSKEDEPMLREEDDAAESAPSTDAQALNAYVYTFDSLGSRHSAAASRLAKYLRFEAQDKKGLKIDDTRLAVWKNAKSPMQTNFCDCGLFVLAFVEAFMKDPTRAGDMIRQSQAEWYTGRRENFRGPFRDRTLVLSEEWKKERAAKEDAKAGVQEGQKDKDKDKDEAAGDKDKDKDKEEGAKEAEEKPKPKQPEATVVEDSDDDDEVIISEIRLPSKASRGGKKGNSSGRAARIR
ncbi:hypothetical protein GSI_15621 [Ganoderma sinense ZZ0214-1]|uniref:Ubiquitin-like protease family profile domain-containing protein n=1 Tax=Ganoderma sinense ZZ0214-1 TaxID=1077348 RepID=A0A2G8RN32_9APHY|nr:hypothetical protein GSI_15621 [Ganoderma sinense ZZ0214-1]